MKRNTRILTAAIFVAMIVPLVFSCSKKEPSGGKKDGISIVATIFPEYDWVRQICGSNEKINLSLLMKNGVDMHSFTPTTKDMINLSTCDILIYVGGESDAWIQSALKNKTNKNLVEINLMEILGDGIKEEELVEGMEAEEECEEEEVEETEYDEHVWLSVKNAKTLCKKITAEICRLLPEDSESFEKNLSAYIKQLDELDGEFKTACDSLDSKTLIFCDRFPFRYFTDDYNLDYYAAFLGCSAESEASFKTIAFLGKKVDELAAKKVFVLEKSDQKIARTVIANSKAKDAKIIVMDSMQSATDSDIKNGKTYISTMKKNLESLR